MPAACIIAEPSKMSIEKHTGFVVTARFFWKMK